MKVTKKKMKKIRFEDTELYTWVQRIEEIQNKVHKLDKLLPFGAIKSQRVIDEIHDEIDYLVDQMIERFDKNI